MITSAVVFDLFHTLVDTEHLRPPGFDEIDAVADVCRVDPAALRDFWDATYVERETTSIDLVDLLQRHVGTVGVELTTHQRSDVDAIFGVTKDEALRRPIPAMVHIVRDTAANGPVGVLSNCHEREVRCWPESPLSTGVSVFGRSSRIGTMKPHGAAYDWVLTRLAADPFRSVYVGNGSSDELAGARRAGFGTVIHCNVFDRSNGLVDGAEQRRRAEHADASVDSIDDLAGLLAAEPPS